MLPKRTKPASKKRGGKKLDAWGPLLQVCTICLAAGVFDPRGDGPPLGRPSTNPRNEEAVALVSS